MIHSEQSNRGLFDAAGRRAAMVTARGTVRAEPDDDTSSRADRSFAASREWPSDDGFFDIGEIVAWLSSTRRTGKGERTKLHGCQIEPQE